MWMVVTHPVVPCSLTRTREQMQGLRKWPHTLGMLVLASLPSRCPLAWTWGVSTAAREAGFLATVRVRG